MSILLRPFSFECCNPSSVGEPEFLTNDPQFVSARTPSNLSKSHNGRLQLWFERWRSERHDRVRAVVIIHHGEVDHAGWYNGLAVRLTAIGCAVFAPDAQGHGQSDGARGYFESFENVVLDFVEFTKQKYGEVAAEHNGRGLRPPGLVLVGKGFGALVTMQAVVSLREEDAFLETRIAMVFLSPGFQFTPMVTDGSSQGCGLAGSSGSGGAGGRCNIGGQRSGAGLHQAGAPGVGCVAPGQAEDPENAPGQVVEQMAKWFPKMIVAPPVDPDNLSRDPQVVDRMNRDCLCWHQGYRARVLAEILQEQRYLGDHIKGNPEIFSEIPALLLHGSADRLFTVHGTHAVHTAWCELIEDRTFYPRLKIYDGAYHMLLNEPNREEVLRDISLFVADKVSG